MQQESCPNCGQSKQRKDAVFCSHCRFPLVLIAGKYRLESLLAEGGQGAVYLARHIQLDRDPLRVVKIVKQELFDRMPALLERFRREVQVTSALSQRCQHIVRIYDDFGEVPQIGRFYVMEYLQGKPLADLLLAPDTLPSLKESLHIFLQLCDAMRFAHREHIVHRDLKPDNIMLIEYEDEPLFLKVLDFGIARPSKDDDQTGPKLTEGIIGTPAYMAPEQLNGSEIDTRTDIYAMGCIFFEVLTGQTPHHTEGAGQEVFLELAMKKLTTPAPSPRQLCPDRDIPEDLEAIILKMLAQGPDQRYHSVEEIKQALKQVLKQLQQTRPGFTDTMPEELPYVSQKANSSSGDASLFFDDVDLPTGDLRGTTPAPAFHENEDEEATSISLPPRPSYTMGYQEEEATAIATSPFYNETQESLPASGPSKKVLLQKTEVGRSLAPPKQAAPPSHVANPNDTKTSRSLTPILVGVIALLLAGVGGVVWLVQPTSKRAGGASVPSRTRRPQKAPQRVLAVAPRRPPVTHAPSKAPPVVVPTNTPPSVAPAPRTRRSRPKRIIPTRPWSKVHKRRRPIQPKRRVSPPKRRVSPPRRAIASNQPVCPPDSAGYHWLQVKYSPRRVGMKVLPSGLVQGSRIRNRRCVGFKSSSARLRITRKGYHACELPLTRKNKRIHVKLNIDDQGGLFLKGDNYCKKSW